MCLLNYRRGERRCDKWSGEWIIEGKGIIGDITMGLVYLKRREK